jgi:hypothetical protein
MAHALSTHSLRDFFVAQSPTAKRSVVKRPGPFARLIHAMEVSRQHQAEREIARFVASRGDKFTDETEREIERRFLSSPSGW